MASSFKLYYLIGTMMAVSVFALSYSFITKIR